MNSSINAVVQRAALAALRLGAHLADPVLATYQRRRDLVIKRIADMDTLEVHEPQGTFYAFARYRGGRPSTEITALPRAGGVAVRAGSEYGPTGQGHIRLSFAADLDTLEEGLSRIDMVLSRL
jgi:aspartate aminotransferase